MQSWPLERKIRVTQLRIIEWYEHFNGNVYVSFSGGKDSTVLLDLVRRIYPDVPAVYADTGLEYPELKEFVRSKDNVTIIRPKMVFTDVISQYGYPIIGKEVAEAIYYARQIHPKRRAKAEREREREDRRGRSGSSSWEHDRSETDGDLGKKNKYSGGGKRTLISRGLHCSTNKSGFLSQETYHLWFPITAATL